MTVFGSRQTVMKYWRVMKMPSGSASYASVSRTTGVFTTTKI